jgi:hypothetical protein
LTISNRNLADLAFAGLLDFYKEKLDGQEFLNIGQVLQKSLANESWAKEARNLQKSNEKPNRPVYILGCESNCSDDEGKDVHAADFAWPSNDKSCTFGSLKPIQKNRQDNINFTFDVSKCDRIFDELNRLGCIKLSHVIPPLEELKRHAYSKWHNSLSHATNDCNVFRRQNQSAVNKTRLVVTQMQIDNNPFPVHTVELHNSKVLIRPNQTESLKGKNVVIGEPRSEQKKKSLEASTVGGQDQKKGARSVQTGPPGSLALGGHEQQKSAESAQTGLTGHTGSSGKNSSRSRRSDQIRLRIQNHH